MRPSLIGLWLLAVGCSSASYDVLVYVPGGVDRALRVELSLLSSCDEVITPGDEPSSALRIAEVTGGRVQRFGRVDSGAYGLYARAWEEGCRLFAAGCDYVWVDGDTGGTVEVSLGEITVRGCDSGDVCEHGLCETARDAGGLDEDSGADTDGETPRECGPYETDTNCVQEAQSGRLIATYDHDRRPDTEELTVEDVAALCVRECGPTSDLSKCVADCIYDDTDEAISIACGRCFGDVAVCGYGVCGSCINHESPECIACLCAECCAEGFDACSGVPRSEDYCSGEEGDG